MNYAATRPHIKTGDLLFWSHGSWASWADVQVLAVRTFTTSEYSHVGVAWVALGRVFVLHAIGRGICIEPLSTQGSFYWVPMDRNLPETALEIGFARVGERYSKLQAIFGYLRKLAIGDDNLWQCAEFAIWLWRQAGVSIADVATPAAIVRAQLAAGKALQYVEL